MSTGVDTVSADMSTGSLDYGATNGQREELSGYFDVNNEGVHTKKSRCDVWCMMLTKKKKICLGVTVGVILLLIIIIAGAVSTKAGRRILGIDASSSKQLGKGCSGNSSAQFNCQSGGGCIMRDFMCDGYPDCPDGYDEADTFCKNQCKIGQFRCHVKGNCIDVALRCDANIDCGGDDVSDEQNCFAINADTAEVTLTKKGFYHPMSASIDFRVGETICEQLGFQAIRLPLPDPAPVDPTIGEQCGILDYDEYDPDSLPTSIEDAMSNKVELRDCKQDIGKLRLQCETDSCGLFGKFIGPEIPKTWVEKTPAAPGETPFPWVVDIFQGDSHVCKGTIINEEWVITTAACVDNKKIFAASGSNSDYKVMALAATDEQQEVTVTKVIRNHIKVPNNEIDLQIAAVQVSPPFRYEARAACLVEPAWLPHYVCFAAGTTKEGKMQHVRVIPQTDGAKCAHGTPTQADYMHMCFEYPHPGGELGSDHCVKETRGSPVSCLDPATNSWTIGGIITVPTLGCPETDGDFYHGEDMRHQLNFFWTEAVADITEPVNIPCGRQQYFESLRYMRGSRYNEFYVDVKGFGEHAHWYTIYNLTGTLGVFSKEFERKFGNPNIRIVKTNTGIKTKRSAVLDCPPHVENICACRLVYKDVNLEEEAMSLHLVTDIDNDDDIDYLDQKFEYWDNDTSIDDLYYDYDAKFEDQTPMRGTVDIVLPNACDKDGFRKCNSTYDTCVPDEYVCDSYKDCPGGEDEPRLRCESMMGYECPRDYFRCNSTYECLPPEKLCDGELDCNDASDERYCVRVNENGTLLLQQSGVLLPFGGSREIMSATETLKLGITLCQAAGYGAYVSITAEAASHQGIFGLGCFKLVHQYAYGSSIKVHSQFTRYRADLCNSTYTLICQPAQCGLFGEYVGPIVPDVKDEQGNPLYRPPVPRHHIIAESEPYPWMVHIKQGDRTLCPATIIHKQWILTSADCVSTLDESMTILLDTTKEHNRHICHKVLYNSANQPTDRNLALVNVQDFNIDASTRPICMIFPLYLPGSICFAAGVDKDDKIQHMKVLPAAKSKCGLSDNDQFDSCVEYVGEDKDTTCVKTTGGPLQCIDPLKRRFSLPAILTGDIGGGCADGKTTAKSMDMIHLLEWISYTIEDIPGDSVNCVYAEDVGPQPRQHIDVHYMRGEVADQWYMRSTAGEIIEWDTQDTLNLLTRRILRMFGSREVVFDDAQLQPEGRRNITTLRTVTLSTCNEELTCTCSKVNKDGPERDVSMFYLVGADPNKEAENEDNAQDEDGIIYNPNDQQITIPSYDDQSDGLIRSDPAHRGLPQEPAPAGSSGR